MLKSQLPVENNVLSDLPRPEYLRLLEKMDVFKLKAGEVVSEPNAVIQHVYFPCTCMLSLLSPVDAQEFFTVGLVGREGMAGVACALGSQVSPFRVIVQNTGRAFRMPTDVFLAEYQSSKELRELVNKYSLSLTMQIAQTAACNRYHVIEERVARWLLMTRDKLSSNHFHMTHEALSQMIGVHRVGVTHAAHMLKSQHLIDYSRGEIYILDGAGLQAASCSCYRRVAEYRYAQN